MVTIRTYFNWALAEIIRGRLETEGIHAFLDDDSAYDGGIRPIQNARIRVPDEEAGKAVELLGLIEKEVVAEEA